MKGENPMHSNYPLIFAGCGVALGLATAVAAAAGRLDGSGDVCLSLSDATRSSCGWGTPRDGSSVTGAPLRIGSMTFERGIGTHAPAELVFPAGGQYRWLTFYAGVSEEMTEAGSITVQVWLDGKKVHETPVMRVKEEPLCVSLPIQGAKEVRIVGTDAGNGVGADHVCLGNLRLCVGEKEPAPDGPKPSKPLTISPLKDLAGRIPDRGVASTEPAKRWEFALVSGNGRLGAMVFGHPTRETVIANHCRLFLPLGSREIVPDLAQHVPELRKTIREQGYGKAMDFFLGKAKEQGFPGLIWTDPFHPGFFLTVRMPQEGEIRDYVRMQDFATGEVAVRWRDDAGAWHRRLFVSRTDNAIVISVSGPGLGKLSCTLTPERVGEKRIQSELKVENGWATYHNVYQHGKGGYDAALRVVPRGGRMDNNGEAIQVTGADEVLVLLRIVPWKTPLPKEGSEAWGYSPENPDFAADRLGQYTPAPPLADSSVVAYRSTEDARALLPKLKESLAALPADYGRLFEPHAKAHGELFGRVTLDVGGGADRAKSTEELLEVATKEKRLPAALLEKMVDAGRYMFICSAGELPPNLQGIWTGTWTPAWSGDFTLDTNLQLALKHGLSGNLPELMEGHYRLIESFIPDWRLNARRIYGCRGVLSNARASNNCLLLHWGGWQGVFWTAGAGWLSHFFHDRYLYTGDRDFLARRVVPLLKEVVAFYEDFLVVNGEAGFYEFIPSYSPESSTGITATMDVMVAREALASLVEACETLGIEAANVPRWKGMLAKLPPYHINKDGALAEFVPDGYGEWYGHRHLSHLHAAYEATGELSPERTPEVWKAAQEATRRRINADGEQSSHGRAHMGLAAAHLRLAEEAYGRVAIMAIRRSMYPSLMCSHEPNQQIFNVDANGAIPEIVNRMVVSSRPGLLDLLPALPAAMPRGAIRGILARGQIRIESLEWDTSAGRILLQLTSGADQSLALRLPNATTVRITRAEQAEVKPSNLGPNAITLVLREGQPATIEAAVLLAPSGARQAAAETAMQEIDRETMDKWAAPYRGWHYQPEHVIPAQPNIPGCEKFHSTDVPCVYQLPGQPGKWLMSFIAFDGQGYNSFVAESTDLVHWTNPRLAMGFGPKGEFDHGGCVLGAYLYESYDIKAQRLLKKRDGKYWSLYGCYPRQGGYELRPGYEGLACSDDGLSWGRAQPRYILSVHEPDRGEWEKDCIYQPWLVEHAGRFWNFYNAANRGVEQMGLATSSDLRTWTRHAASPIVRNRPGGFDERFCSDGKVFWDGDHWVMFYFGVGRGGAHIMVAFSRDLVHWTAHPEPLYRAGGNPSGLDRQYAHKISLVWNPANETFYMHYCACGNKGRGVGLVTSKPLTAPR